MLAIVNREPTGCDDIAVLVVRASADETLAGAAAAFRAG